MFSGIVPRVLWITIGGFIYFGVYGQVVLLSSTTETSLNSTSSS